jgi:hypothetical protein
MTLQHNRQHIATKGFASAATARKLIASQTIAPHVIAATVECNDYAKEITVVACRAIRHQVKCGVELQAGQIYFMVRSAKFTNRWYVFSHNTCSSRDVLTYCTAQVEAYKANRLVAA